MFAKGWAHWIYNLSDRPAVAYFNYNHEKPETVEVSNVIGHFNAIGKGRIVERLKAVDTE